MRQTLIRYETKLERAEENERLIKHVFEELHAKLPEGIRYMALRLGSNAFVHFVAVDTVDGSNPIPHLDAFRSFQSDIGERCVEPPQSSDAAIIGNYRMLNE